MMKSNVPNFWKTIPLEELAREQGVKPILNLEELAGLWPADDDPEEILRFILDQRRRGRGRSRDRSSVAG